MSKILMAYSFFLSLLIEDRSIRRRNLLNYNTIRCKSQENTVFIAIHPTTYRSGRFLTHGVLNRICSITKTYNCCNPDTQCHCNDCKQLMNKWLDEYDKQVRADVIEEFVKAIEKHQTRQDNYLDPPYVEMGLDMTDVLGVAEKLKEQ